MAPFGSNLRYAESDGAKSLFGPGNFGFFCDHPLDHQPNPGRQLSSPALGWRCRSFYIFNLWARGALLDADSVFALH